MWEGATQRHGYGECGSWETVNVIALQWNEQRHVQGMLGPQPLLTSSSWTFLGAARA